MLIETTVTTLAKTGRQIDSAKSNTNYKMDSPRAQEIGKDGTYRYLGVHEVAANLTYLKTKTNIQEEMFNRIHKLCLCKWGRNQPREAEANETEVYLLIKIT